MKVQVTSSNRTRAPYRIDTLLTESIALDYTVKRNFCRTRARKNFRKQKSRPGTSCMRPAFGFSGVIGNEESGAAFEVGSRDRGNRRRHDDKSGVVNVGG